MHIAMDEYIISTERLLLRTWQERDFRPFVAMNSDLVVREYFSKTLTEQETEQFIARTYTGFEKNGFGLHAVAIKADHRLIGFSGFASPGFATISLLLSYY